jgi:2-oxoisovalerate dehydrogenase E2 component (dihydrolipoyl transacylase)
MKNFKLPDLGEGLAEAEIVRWHVKSGDHVKADDPMLAVETAKAVVEVPSPFSGIIKALHGNPGDTVATGTLLVEFEPDGSADAGTVVGRMPTSDEDFLEEHLYSAEAFLRDADRNRAASQTGHVRAVPAARALSKRLGIDLTQVRGTGRGELVTVDDVLRAAPLGRSPTTGAAPLTPGDGALASHPAVPSDALASDAAGPRDNPGRGAAALLHGPAAGPAEPLRGPRRAMAQSMALARNNVMGCTLFDDADLHEWREEQDITTRLLRAIAAACAAEPALNAWFDGGAQTRTVLQHVDVAIAVDTPQGLIVPVIRNIRDRPVAELRGEVDRLKRSTLDRTVKPEELRDFTFMLSNFGMIAGRYATPVVVPPAVAILGCGRLSQDVVATQNGAIEVHRRMPLSLTFDHRCVTGGEAARFMAAIIQDLQKGS